MNKNVECDTNKMRDAAKDIQKLANEINTKINQMYKLFDEMTGEAWIGKTSKEYSNTVFIDKQEYIDYINSVNRIATELENLADKTDQVINQCEREADSI